MSFPQHFSEAQIVQLEVKLTEHFIPDAAAWPISIKSTTEETTCTKDTTTYKDHMGVAPPGSAGGGVEATDGGDHTHETTTRHLTTIEVRLNRAVAEADRAAIREIVQLIMVENLVGPIDVKPL